MPGQSKSAHEVARRGLGALAIRPGTIALKGDDTPPVPPLGTKWVFSISFVLLVVCFLSSAGRVGLDTKFDLYVNPWGFLERALHFWDANGMGGRVQNQAYGYLWPMGPFFGVAHSLGLPTWVAQRVWMALLLVTGYLGTALLARRLRAGDRLSWHLAGVIFALSPRAITEVGTVTAELLPTMVLPWVVLPLVRGMQGANARRSAAWSGLAIFMMGGINAAAVIMLLVLPGIIVLTNIRRPGGKALAGWWSLAVVCATAWWLGPLFLMGQYGLNFLRYTETSEVTTMHSTIDASLRGATHWVPYVADQGRLWWPAGNAVSVGLWLTAAGAVIAAVGIYGLAQFHSRWRFPLMLSALLGLALLTAGHVTNSQGFQVSSPIAQWINQMLDGPLAPFRNTHKFDANTRLPLAIGVAVAVDLSRRLEVRVATLVSVALSLIMVASPALAGKLVPPGAYREIPSYWTEATTWLNDNPAAGSVLAVPGSPFAEFTWGRPLDDPLQSMSSRRWMSRYVVVQGSEGMTRWLDMVDEQLVSGRGSPALAEVLRRAGVKFVLVRADLDVARTTPPRLAYLHAALRSSKGISEAASFGGMIGQQDRADGGQAEGWPAITIYEIDGDVPSATAQPLKNLAQVSGGPEAVLPLAEADDISQRPLVMTQDMKPTIQPSDVVVTDTMRRRSTSFARIRDNASATQASPTEGGPPVALDVGPLATRLRTTQTWIGARSVTTSSNAGDPTVTVLRSPANGPWAIFDSNVTTVWSSDPGAIATEQWLEIEFDEPTNLRGATINFAGGLISVNPSQIRVTAGADSDLQRVATNQPIELNVPDSPVDRLRIEINEIQEKNDDGSPRRGMVSIRELSIPDLSIRRALKPAESLVPPSEDAKISGSVSTEGVGKDLVVSGDTEVGLTEEQKARDNELRQLPRAWRFSKLPDSGPCVVIRDGAACRPGWASRSEDSSFPLTRVISVDQKTTVGIRGTAQYLGLPYVDAKLSPKGLTAKATSTIASSGGSNVLNLFDSNPATSWVAAVEDTAPKISIEFDKEQTITSLELTPPSIQVASRPRNIGIVTSGSTTVFNVRDDGSVPIPPLKTKRLELVFNDVVRRQSVDSRTKYSLDMAVGIGDIRMGGLRGVDPVNDNTPIELRCGQGPMVNFDGKPHQTKVVATAGEYRRNGILPWETCDDEEVTLTAGEHTITAAEVFGFSAKSLNIDELAENTARNRSVQSVDGDSWKLKVSAGQEAILSLPQNAAPGWTATADGTPLQSIVVDGWRQGFIVPAGESVTVDVSYGPEQIYRTMLSIGFFLVLALIPFATFGASSRRISVRSPSKASLARSVAITAVERRDIVNRTPWTDKQLKWWDITVVTGFVVVAGLWGAVVGALYVLIRRRYSEPHHAPKLQLVVVGAISLWFLSLAGRGFLRGTLGIIGDMPSVAALLVIGAVLVLVPTTRSR